MGLRGVLALLGLACVCLPIRDDKDQAIEQYRLMILEYEDLRPAIGPADDRRLKRGPGANVKRKSEFDTYLQRKNIILKSAYNVRTARDRTGQRKGNQNANRKGVRVLKKKNKTAKKLQRKKNKKEWSSADHHWENMKSGESDAPKPPKKKAKQTFIPHIVYKNPDEWTNSDIHWDVDHRYYPLAVDEVEADVNVVNLDTVDRVIIDYNNAKEKADKTSNSFVDTESDTVVDGKKEYGDEDDDKEDDEVEEDGGNGEGEVAPLENEADEYGQYQAEGDETDVLYEDDNEDDSDQSQNENDEDNEEADNDEETEVAEGEVAPLQNDEDDQTQNDNGETNDESENSNAESDDQTESSKKYERKESAVPNDSGDQSRSKIDQSITVRNETADPTQAKHDDEDASQSADRAKGQLAPNINNGNSTELKINITSDSSDTGGVNVHNATGKEVTVDIPQTEKSQRNVVVVPPGLNKKSVVVNVRPDEDAKLEGDGLLRKLKIPKFISTAVSVTSHSFTIHMSHGTFYGVEGWLLIAVKLKQDEWGRPEFQKSKPADYKIASFPKYAPHPTADKPYVTASFSADNFPYKFVLGDGRAYEGCENGRLEGGEMYGLFVAGVVRTKRGRVVYVESGWIEDAHAPGMPAYYPTKPKPNVAKPLIILFAILLAFSGIILCSIKYISNNRVLREAFEHRLSNQASGSNAYKFSRVNQEDDRHHDDRQYDVIKDEPEELKKIGKKKFLKNFVKPKKRMSNPKASKKGISPRKLPQFSDEPKQLPSYPGNSLRGLSRHFADRDQLEGTVYDMVGTTECHVFNEVSRDQ